MPIPRISGEFINLECTVPFLEEFPDLLIAESTDDGVVYFDATAYIEAQKNESLSVDKFFYIYHYLHTSLTKTLELDPKKVVRANRKNHILIDATFAFLFISYVSPEFIAYANNKLMDMFCNGVAFSEAYVAQLASNLPGDILLSLANGTTRTETNDGVVQEKTGDDSATKTGADV